MSELNVVVIGGVSCGPKSAARLKRLMPEANVTLIERGKIFLMVAVACHIVLVLL